MNRMKRSHVLIMVLIIGVLLAIAIRYSVKTEGRRKREAFYSRSLQEYSRDLKPGMSRKDVESYIRARKIQFTQMCCIPEGSTPADLVEIGREDPPWFCAENFVSITFDFGATKKHESWNALESDVLKNVTIYRGLAACL
jgi:hypothetical protein